MNLLILKVTIYFSICLEWNALGMLDQAFSVFCEGLGANLTLQHLDLRNNQINHDGAAELAGALRRNTTLRVLGNNNQVYKEGFFGANKSDTM